MVTAVLMTPVIFAESSQRLLKGNINSNKNFKGVRFNCVWSMGGVCCFSFLLARYFTCQNHLPADGYLHAGCVYCHKPFPDLLVSAPYISPHQHILYCCQKWCFRVWSLFSDVSGKLYYKL